MFDNDKLQESIINISTNFTSKVIIAYINMKIRPVVENDDRVIVGGEKQKQFDHLKKAEAAWRTTTTTTTSTNSSSPNHHRRRRSIEEINKKVCCCGCINYSKIDRYLPHDHWVTVVYRLIIFYLLVIYVNNQLGNDVVFEVSELFKAHFPDKSYM